MIHKYINVYADNNHIYSLCDINAEQHAPWMFISLKRIGKAES